MYTEKTMKQYVEVFTSLYKQVQLHLYSVLNIIQWIEISYSYFAQDFGNNKFRLGSFFVKVLKLKTIFSLCYREQKNI